MKRMLDLVVALIVFVITSPIFLVVCIIVRIKLGSPILFKQQRPGLHGIPFYIYKLRTMTNQKDEQGQYLPDYIRLTKVGKILRKLSLDELPQLINVIKGDLSLVGPRPLLMKYLPLYNSFQARRHEVKPGITGWAQVNGRNSISWEEKFKLDVWYVDNGSFWLDIKILWMTALKVIKKEGISLANHATMPEFQGSPLKESEETK